MDVTHGEQIEPRHGLTQYSLDIDRLRRDLAPHLWCICDYARVNHWRRCIVAHMPAGHTWPQDRELSEVSSKWFEVSALLNLVRRAN
jgi:hypothetical protein